MFDVTKLIGIDLLTLISDRPDVIWLIALIGAVCVVGVVEYLRSFFERKKNAIRWVVLVVSLIVAVIISMRTWLATILIIFLLILALAVIGKRTIVDGIQAIINKITGAIPTNGNSNGGHKE